MIEAEIQALTEELRRAAEVLHQLRCLPATDGNFSVRISRDRILITRAGIEKRSLSRESFVTLDLSDDRPAWVSSEWRMHRAVYAGRPEVRCLIHVHAPLLSCYAVVHEVPDISLLAEGILAIGEIALVPYHPPGTAELGEAILLASQTASLYILANHGILSLGSTVDEALHRVERGEFLAEVEWRARTLSRTVPIPAATITALRELHSGSEINSKNQC